MSGGSNNIMDATVAGFISLVQPVTALDIGVGAGKMGNLIRERSPACVTDGIDPFAPHVERLRASGAASPYRHLEIAAWGPWSQQHVDWTRDLVTFGDVLEHMGTFEAIDALGFALYRARYVIAVWPELCRQGSLDGNTFEAHRSRIHLADIARFDVRQYVKLERTSDRYQKHAALIRGFL